MLGSAHDILMFSACTCRCTTQRCPLEPANCLVCSMHATQHVFSCSCLLFSTPWADLLLYVLLPMLYGPSLVHGYCIQPLHTVFSNCVLHSATALHIAHCGQHHISRDHHRLDSPLVYGTGPLCWFPSQSAHAPWPGRSTAAVVG